MLYKIALTLALLHASTADAKVTRLSLGLKRMPFNADAMFPGHTKWEAETDLLWDVSLGRWFAENDVTGRTYGSRYRYVSWRFSTGVQVTPWLDLVWDHHSQHGVDLYIDRFAVKDGYGIRLHFVE